MKCSLNPPLGFSSVLQKLYCGVCSKDEGVTQPQLPGVCFLSKRGKPPAFLISIGLFCRNSFPENAVERPGTPFCHPPVTRRVEALLQSGRREHWALTQLCTHRVDISCRKASQEDQRLLFLPTDMFISRAVTLRKVDCSTCPQQ